VGVREESVGSQVPQKMTTGLLACAGLRRPVPARIFTWDAQAPLGTEWARPGQPFERFVTALQNDRAVGGRWSQPTNPFDPYTHGG